MTDKINTIFDNIDNELGVFTSNVKSIKSELEIIDDKIENENIKIDEKLKIFRPIEGIIPVSAGGSNKKTFLEPKKFRDTYQRIKITGGSKQDINNMIYTIEKMQNMGINRDFFPRLLQSLVTIGK